MVKNHGINAPNRVELVECLLNTGNLLRRFVEQEIDG